MVEKQLARYGMQPDKCCSEAFINSLRKFLEDRRNKLEKKIKYVEDFGGDEKSEIIEKVAHKTSGITEKQLEVIAVYSSYLLLTKAYCIYLFLLSLTILFLDLF